MQENCGADYHEKVKFSKIGGAESCESYDDRVTNCDKVGIAEDIGANCGADNSAAEDCGATNIDKESVAGICDDDDKVGMNDNIGTNCGADSDATKDCGAANCEKESMSEDCGEDEI